MPYFPLSLQNKERRNILAAKHICHTDTGSKSTSDESDFAIAAQLFYGCLMYA
jgi:hypothetical protein